MLFSKKIRPWLELIWESSLDQQWGFCYPCQKTAVGGHRYPILSKLREEGSPAALESSAVASSATTVENGEISQSLARGLLRVRMKEIS
jgi:hypothetical protein